MLLSIFLLFFFNCLFAGSPMQAAGRRRQFQLKISTSFFFFLCRLHFLFQKKELVFCTFCFAFLSEVQLLIRVKKKKKHFFDEGIKKKKLCLVLVLFCFHCAMSLYTYIYVIYIYIYISSLHVAICNGSLSLLLCFAAWECWSVSPQRNGRERGCTWQHKA